MTVVVVGAWAIAKVSLVVGAAVVVGVAGKRVTRRRGAHIHVIRCRPASGVWFRSSHPSRSPSTASAPNRHTRTLTGHVTTVVDDAFPIANVLRIATPQMVSVTSVT